MRAAGAAAAVSDAETEQILPEAGEDATTDHSGNVDGVGGARFRLVGDADRTRGHLPGEVRQRDLAGFARVVVGAAYIGFVGRNVLSCGDSAVEPRNHAFQLGAETA